jgi:hypothetical protein
MQFIAVVRVMAFLVLAVSGIGGLSFVVWGIVAATSSTSEQRQPPLMAPVMFSPPSTPFGPPSQELPDSPQPEAPAEHAPPVPPFPQYGSSANSQSFSRPLSFSAPPTQPQRTTFTPQSEPVNLNGHEHVINRRSRAARMVPVFSIVAIIVAVVGVVSAFLLTTAGPTNGTAPPGTWCPQITEKGLNSACEFSFSGNDLAGSEGPGSATDKLGGQPIADTCLQPGQCGWLPGADSAVGTVTAPWAIIATCTPSDAQSNASMPVYATLAYQGQTYYPWGTVPCIDSIPNSYYEFDGSVAGSVQLQALNGPNVADWDVVLVQK